MPRPRGFGKGETARANVRLDPDTLAFYKTRANEYGVSLSEYLRQLLTQGVTTETVASIEARLNQAGDEIATKVSRAQAAHSMPILLQRALLETHAMLTKIVEAQDIQALYDAQEIAKAKLARLHSAPPQNPA
jgi:plasmid stability protein